MAVDDGYPTWARVALVVLQVIGVVVGLALGNLTYEAWSAPDGPDLVTTTSADRD